MTSLRIAIILLALSIASIIAFSSQSFHSKADSPVVNIPKLSSDDGAVESKKAGRPTLLTTGIKGLRSLTGNSTYQAPVALDNEFWIHVLGTIDFLSDDSGNFTGVHAFLTFPQHGNLDHTTNEHIYSFLVQPTYFTGFDSFIYQVCDNDNLNDCASATVTLHLYGDDGDLGPNSCNAHAGGPINVTNGNMYLQQTDYRLPGVGPMIDVTRTYNSMSQRVGLFGKGWSAAYDESISISPANTLRFNQADGRAIYFGSPAGSTGPLVPVVGDFHGRLTQGSGGFTLTMKDGSVHQFNLAGRLGSFADRNGNQTTLAYDTSGHLTSVTDPFGRVLIFTPDSNGRVTSISDSMGTVAVYSYDSGNTLHSVTYADNSFFEFAYDSSARLTSVKDALLHTVESHTYDGQGRALTSERDSGVEHYDLAYVSATRTDVTNALGQVSKYTFDTSKGRNVVTQVEGVCSCGGSGSQIQTWTYDNQLNVTAKTDALGHTTSNTYDSNGNRLTETDAIGTTAYTYNQFAEVLTATDKMNGVTTNTYNTAGDLLTVNDALSHTTTLAYDSRGQAQTLTDARGKVTTFTWDTSGRLTQRTDALNHDTNFAYDARARLTSVTNALNETTSYEYDAAGRLMKTTFPDSNFVSSTYDLGGRRTKVTDARGHDTNSAYDGADRLISVTDALSHAVSHAYDLMSNQTSRTDALGRVTNYEYDDFNHLNKVIYPLATTGATRLQETIEYDVAGNVKKKTDTAGRDTTYLYDAVNRLTKITDPLLQQTQFEYNARSLTTGVLDALNQHYTFAYDPLGRTTGMTRASVSMSYGYDAVGNRTSRTDYNGVTTSYSFNDLNRLTAISYPNSTNATYGYDELSRLTSATNENGTVGFTYDNRGRVDSTTDVFNKTLSYGYDENGNRLAVAIGGLDYAAYVYDAVNRLTDLSDGSAVVASYGYDATNKATSRNLINGVNSTYEYDGLNRLTRLRDVKATMTVLDNQYGYNAASQIVGKTTPGATQNFGYDATDRLSSVVANGSASESYTYDAVGNRTSSFTDSELAYASFNRLTSIRRGAYGDPNSSRSYDNNGNLIQGPFWQSGLISSVPESYAAYSYDFENRLTQVVEAWLDSLFFGWNYTTVNYQYDALGRRIARSTSNGDVQKFVYDGQNVIQDLNDSGQVITSYLNGPGVDNKIRQTDANGNLYYSKDHLGSTNALTNDSGQVVESIGYDSFGNSTGSGYTRYTYTGREFDADTGLYYYRARWYDPQVGRFISEDPARFRGGLNWYAYVDNDPVNFRDPTGLGPILNLEGEPWLDDRNPEPIWPRYFIFGDGGIFSSATYKEFISATERAKQPCRPFGERFVENFSETNQALPGAGAPIGFGLITAGKISEISGEPGIFRLAWDGFYPRSAVPSALGRAGLNKVAVTASFEGGVAIGSYISAAGCPCGENKPLIWMWNQIDKARY